jgi:NTE family protein
MGTAVVLGAGGRVGIAYHAGSLRALRTVAGIDAATADLLVGTSAGSVVAARLRSGFSVDDLWDLIHDDSPDGPHRRGDALFSRAWKDPMQLARRAIGSTWVIGRSMVRVPTPRIPHALRNLFPGGMLHVEAHADLEQFLPLAWPEQPLWLCAVDIRTGRRVVLGHPGSRTRADLHRGVLASCAVPGVYQPVRAGGRTLVDGGVHSSTNLDLVAATDIDRVVALVPLGLATPARLDPAMQVLRRRSSRAVRREAAVVAANGIEVLVVEATGAEARLHGANALRTDGGPEIARAAYDATARQLEAALRRRDVA